jgi:hypothetical protein
LVGAAFSFVITICIGGIGVASFTTRIGGAGGVTGGAGRGRELVDHRVFENINAGPYQPEGSIARRAKAEELVAVAQAQGVSKHEMEEEAGDLAVYLSGAMETADRPWRLPLRSH